jgi:hypothetical protein
VSSGGVFGLELATDPHVDVVTGGSNDENVADENVELGDRLGLLDSLWSLPASELWKGSLWVDVASWRKSKLLALDVVS